MDIIHAGAMEWGANLASHRAGGMSHKVLFEGEEGGADNFLFVLANEGSDYYSPRHRHAWDQVRFCIEGSVPIGKTLSVDEGETAYFPEGVHYGPQEGGPDRIVLLLQFGGASGLGYLSAAQLRQAHAALSEEGRFEKGVFRRERGEGRLNQDAYEAIWNKVTGHDIEYPEPRYKTPIVMRPDAFDWRAEPGAPGVRRRAVGRFPERSLALDLIGLDAGSSYAFDPSDERRLIFVRRGEGRCGQASYSPHTAVRLEPGDAASFAATTRSELFCIAYPLVSARA